MTAREMIREVSVESGLSEDIVRRVMEAEHECIARTLITGEKAHLLGRCTITPRLKEVEVAGEDGKMHKEQVIALSASASKSLYSAIKRHGVNEFTDAKDEVRFEIPKLASMQLEGLV
jgi:hypothetical protein